MVGLAHAVNGSANALAGAGAVVIVCGVLLASSRWLDRLQGDVSTFIESRRLTEHETIRRQMTSPKGIPPSDADVDEVFNQVMKDGSRIVDSLIDARKRVLKLHEVGLVCVGTLINGFAPALSNAVAGLAF